MNPNEDELALLSERIIGCAFKVHNVLGYGFSERVYVNALAHELRKSSLAVQREARILIRYCEVVVGDYFADIIVENLILVETKAVKAFDDGHIAQCLNYLTATGLPLCLLLNFSRKVAVKRFRR